MPWFTDDPLAGRRLPLIAVRLVRSRNELGGHANRKTWPTARLQQCRDPDLPDDDGAVRHGAQADDGVRREPVGPDRSGLGCAGLGCAGLGCAGLGCAGLQHPQPPPEDPEGQHLLSRISRPVAPFDRHRAGKRHRFKRTGEGASRSRAKVSGTPASMAARSVASGARSTLELMSKHWRSGRPSSPPAMWVTRPCCRNCSTEFRPTRRLPALPPLLTVCRQTVAGQGMVPSTPESATTSLPPAVLPQSSHRAKMNRPGFTGGWFVQ